MASYLMNIRVFFKSIILIIALIISFSKGVYAQEFDLKFKGITVQDGLSSNIINDIFRDCRGFMWIATDDGLNLYDGIDFEVFRSVEGDSLTLNSNAIHALHEDCNSRLVVGSSGGVSVYNSSLKRFENVLKGVDVRDIVSYGKDLMLATDQGLIQLDSAFKVINHFQESEVIEESLVTNSLTTLLMDSQKRLWIGEYHKGLSLMIEPGVFVHFNSNNNGINGDFIEEIIETHDGKVLVGTFDQGVFYYNDKEERFRTLVASNSSVLSNSKVVTIYEDEDDHLWVGTDGAGLALYDQKKQIYNFYHHNVSDSRSITDDVVKVIYSDHRGGLWLGTYHRGINFVNKFSIGFKHEEDFPTYNKNKVVSSFEKDGKKNLWIGSDGGGLVYINNETKKKTSYQMDIKDPNSISSNNILCLEYDTRGGLWAGSYFGGVNVLSPVTKKFKHYRHEENDSTSIADDIVWEIIRDSKGRMWLCTASGLSLYRPITDDFVNFNSYNTNLTNDNVRDILEINSNEFYVATEVGFNYFNLEERSFKVYLHDKDAPESISCNFVLKLVPGNQGGIWIGTYGGGLNLFDRKSKTFKSWTMEDGLCNNYVCDIVTDRTGEVWVPTLHGLSKLIVESGRIQNFYYSDGLQDDNFSIGAAMRWDFNTILLGGINGFNKFKPRKIESNNYAPPLYFTDFKVFNEAVQLTKTGSKFGGNDAILDELHLNYDENMLTVHFSALNFIQSEKNQVSYLMEGLDKTWSEPTNISKATYRNLSPGRYVFKVKAANNHGLWNPDTLRLRIIVSPPYYQTWWFLSLVFAVFFLFLFGIYKTRTRRIRLQRVRLKHEVKLRTKEIDDKNVLLVEKEKRRVESLSYAQLIQNAVLSSAEEIQAEVKEMFVLLKPSEIVSGDFYWMEKVDNKVIICAVDCTGHGVPGAFMSMMGNALLNKIIAVDKVFSPSKIMELLHQEVVNSLNRKETHMNDGMDMSIVVIDQTEQIMTFSGAMNPLLYMQKGNMMYVRGTRRSIGGDDYSMGKKFEEHIIDVSEETVFYLYSDGYQDQFGGEGTKYMSRRFRELLYYVHDKPMKEQKKLLLHEHKTWRKGEAEQTDDILVLGVRV